MTKFCDYSVFRMAPQLAENLSVCELWGNLVRVKSTAQGVRKQLSNPITSLDWSALRREGVALGLKLSSLRWASFAFLPFFPLASYSSLYLSSLPQLTSLLPAPPNPASLIWPPFPPCLHPTPPHRQQQPHPPIWVTHHAFMERRSHRNVTIHLGGRMESLAASLSRATWP